MKKYDKVSNLSVCVCVREKERERERERERVCVCMCVSVCRVCVGCVCVCVLGDGGGDADSYGSVFKHSMQWILIHQAQSESSTVYKYVEITVLNGREFCKHMSYTHVLNFTENVWSLDWYCQVDNLSHRHKDSLPLASLIP